MSPTINKILIQKSFLLATLSGGILALAYPGWGVDLGFLAWVGLIPFFLAISYLPPAHSHKTEERFKRRSFAIGFTAGFVYFLIIFRWALSLHPLTALGIENVYWSLAAVSSFYLISATGMALLWGIAVVLIAKITKEFNLRPEYPRGIGLFIIPSIFVLTEFARSWFFGILWLGDGTLTGPHWTLGNLAYSLHGNNLALYLSSYVGIYGLTFLIVSANLIIFKFLSDRKSRQSEPLVLSIVSLVILGITFLPNFINFSSINEADPSGILGTSRKINYAIIQTDIPSSPYFEAPDVLDYFSEKLILLKEISLKYPKTDMIVLPEGSNLSANMAAFQTTEQVSTFYKNLFSSPTLIVDNSRALNKFGQGVSRVIFTDSKRGALGYYDKRLLTPGGEFLPHALEITASILSRYNKEYFEALRGFTIGAKINSTVSFYPEEGDEKKAIKVSSIVCSELFSPSLTRGASAGSDVIVVLTSTAIFGSSPAVVGQDMAIAQFRAAETGKPLLLSANRGKSYAINSSGKIINMIKNEEQKLLTGGISINSRQSWYNVYGDAPILLACFIVIAGLFLLTRFGVAKEGL